MSPARLPLRLACHLPIRPLPHLHSPSALPSSPASTHRRASRSAAVATSPRRAMPVRRRHRDPSNDPADHPPRRSPALSTHHAHRRHLPFPPPSSLPRCAAGRRQDPQRDSARVPRALHAPGEPGRRAEGPWPYWALPEPTSACGGHGAVAQGRGQHFRRRAGGLGSRFARFAIRPPRMAPAHPTAAQTQRKATPPVI